MIQSLSRKQAVWFFALAFMGGVNGFFLSLKKDFEDDRGVLLQEEQETRQEILKAAESRKRQGHYNSLRQKARSEKYACSVSLWSSTELKKKLSKALEKNLLLDFYLVSKDLQKSRLHQQKSFTLFVSAALDTDIYGFMETLSHDLRGLVIFDFISVFREGDGTLKSEIQASILRPCCQKKETKSEKKGEQNG